MTEEALALTSKQAHKLAEYETIIGTNINAFKRVGYALVGIRDERLYLATHTTFDTYCQDRWGMSHQRADQQIRAAQVTHYLGDENSIFITSESQAEALSPLLLGPDPETSIPAVWERVVAAFGSKPKVKEVKTFVPQPWTKAHQEELARVERRGHPLTDAAVAGYHALVEVVGGFKRNQLREHLWMEYPDKRPTHDAWANAKKLGAEATLQEAKRKAAANTKEVNKFRKGIESQRKKFATLAATTSQPAVLKKFSANGLDFMIRRLNDFAAEITTLTNTLEEQL